jgi:cytidylate kinase
MIIAISGKSGCGNTTASKLLSQRLGYRLVNYTFHTMAEEMSIPFPELLERAKADPSYDRHLDETQVRLAMEGDCVIGSRLAIWLLAGKAFTVFLEATPEVRAGRIHAREAGSLAQVIDFTKRRDEMDHERYMRLYGIDNDDYRFADLVLPAGEMKPEQIVEAILKAAGLSSRTG